MDNQFRVTDKPGPTIHESSTRRQYVCRRCGVNFLYFAGMRQFPGGTGYCEEHHQPKVKKQKERVSEKPTATAGTADND